MSMTREEAIVQIESLKNYCEYMADGDESGAYVYDLDEQALDLALTALRPVSREQVEKVWRGEWRLNEEESKKHVEPIYVCTRCENFEAWGNTEKTNFCGYCGAPMTDEAVQMVMERINKMEEMKK